MEIVSRVKCPIYREYLKNTDVVILDEMNGRSHWYCYDKHEYSFKDSGILSEILNKYSFFHELLSN